MKRKEIKKIMRIKRFYMKGQIILGKDHLKKSTIVLAQQPLIKEKNKGKIEKIIIENKEGKNINHENLKKRLFEYKKELDKRKKNELNYI